ncbi:STAS domain-containing protein [Nisaea acidiphila]|uniref:STAS domain-containing protein n=1 Tax=Nisaea acidiphila TaxID=1862145 RepID=A0A9J7AU84_9PROT|nr:STAS domain-containing protein [Nisaea acidiphila]UUX48949.1 STAS domain-containing protein [Nisaea acidiphila]
MEIQTSSIGETHVVTVSGAVDRAASGRFWDALISIARAGNVRMIVDITRVTVLSRPSMRSLITASKLLSCSRGELRVCGAQGLIGARLWSLGLNHLLNCDPTLKASLLALEGSPPEAPRPQSSAMPAEPATAY